MIGHGVDGLLDQNISFGGDGGGETADRGLRPQIHMLPQKLNVNRLWGELTIQPSQGQQYLGFTGYTQNSQTHPNLIVGVAS